MPVPSFQLRSPDALQRHLITSVLSIALFAGLLMTVLTVPVLAQWDASVSASVQSLRSPASDRLMLIITLLGDLRLAFIIFGLVLAGLLYRRRWRLMTHLVSVGISAMISVSVIKSLLTRARPDVPAIVLDSFSFPSGHACTAALTWGLVALMLAHGRRRVRRRIIHGAGFVLVCAIAFSRVYLHVHWPTDVIAGMALGYALLTAFAWQLRCSRRMRMPSLSKLLLVTCLISAAYVSLSYDTQARRYAIPPIHTVAGTQAG